MDGGLWAFLAISVIVIVTPGQDTALTIRNTLLGGRRGGIATAAGVAAGQAVWALASAVGIVALLLSSAPLFAAVKLAGVCYLIFLGAQSLLAAFRRHADTARLSSENAALGMSTTTALRQGVVSNLGNPKMAVFFTSLLPQFAPGGATNFAGLATLGLIFCAITFVWLTIYAIAVARAGDFLRRPIARRILEGITGTALIGLGLRVAAARD